jgi:hypothetical protein
VFEIGNIEERIAEAELIAAANGEQLFVIRIVDPWRNRGAEYEEH